MGLTRVTITGADESIDPALLVDLSLLYPFVEWGILWSWKRFGTPRYPSTAWIGEFTGRALRHGARVRRSLHLCGAAARDVLVGEETPIPYSHFQRIQVNGYHGPAPAFVELARRHPETEFILQARSEPEIVTAGGDVYAIRAGGGRASVLFDPSGGRGVEAQRWPSANVPLGYAGGIKPETVEAVILEILGIAGDADFWIDMESGVRDDDRFSAAKALRVLKAAAPFVARPAKASGR